jgi:hypothetical protein
VIAATINSSASVNPFLFLILRHPMLFGLSQQLSINQAGAILT